ncbi:MAG: guanylate kinase [Planctomycetales bacterium]
MSDSEPNSSEGRIVVLSGPSGSGKTTIVNRLIACAPVRLVKAISATTRPPRLGEAHGEDYYFLSLDEFQRRLDNQEFLEVAEVFKSGYWYGTLKSELDRAWQQRAWALLEIDVQGALQVLERYPAALTIFLRTSSEEEYAARLHGRGTEPGDVIRRRLETAREELKNAGRYRHQVVNDDLDRAVAEISDILQNRERELDA